MKHLITALLFVLVPVSSLFAQEIPQEQIDFVNEFVDAVTSHNDKKIYKCLDKAYRKEQGKFVGSREQLLNELFSGTEVGGSTFVTMKIDDILRIEVAEVEGGEGGNYTYIFRVRDGSNDILAELYLIKKGNKFGFEGARG